MSVENGVYTPLKSPKPHMFLISFFLVYTTLMRKSVLKNQVKISEKKIFKTLFLIRVV